MDEYRNNDNMTNYYNDDYNEVGENKSNNNRKKHKGGKYFFLSVLIVGFVVLCIGGIWIYKTDMTKYMDVKKVNETYSGDKITDISIDYAAGLLVVEKSSNNDIHIMGDMVPSDVEFNVNNISFTVKSQPNKWTNLPYIDDKCKLTIQLPEKVYKNVKLSLGAGQSNIDNIHCNKLDIDMGVGQTNITNITSETYANISCGVGESNFNNCLFSTVNFDCGVGSLNFDGKIHGDANIDAGVGSCSFKLNDPESDYFFSGDNSKHYGSSNGKYNIDLDKGVGDTTFRFSD